MEARNLLVDTSIIIDHLRKKNKKKSRLYNIIDTSDLFVSSISIYELFAGAISEQKRRDVYDFLTLVGVFPFTRETAECAGEIYLSLRDKNKLVDFRDIFIRATALIHNLPLMTLNVNHFERIECLDIVS